MEYKVGDVVRIIKSSYSMDNLKLGDICIVDDVTCDTWGIYPIRLHKICNDNEIGFVGEEHIEHYEQLEISTVVNVEESGIKKGENDMNKVLELYISRAKKTIMDDYNSMIEDARNESEFVKEYNELVKDFETKLEDLFDRERKENGDKSHVFEVSNFTNDYKYTIDHNFTNDTIEELKKSREIELNDLQYLEDEIKAKLSLSDDLEYTLSVLKDYGVINKKSGKLEEYSIK